MALDAQEVDMDEEENAQTSQWYGVREATLFVVDATRKMFEIDPETKLSHIQNFFKLYKQILRQKLAWNMQDWINVILFGTEEKDKYSEWDNMRILHEKQQLQENQDTRNVYEQLLKVVTLDDLQLVRKIMKSDMKGYQSMESDDTYPLHDALLYAMRIFHELRGKPGLTKSRIVLITCHNPELENDEKHRIRSIAKNLKDMDVKVHVIGLGKNWVSSEFYKDLERLSRKTDVYRMISLDDLVQQIKAPSKNIARLRFEICDGLEIDIAVRTLGRKRRWLKTKKISKATNKVLSRWTHYVNEESNDEDNSDNEDNNLSYVIAEEVNLETKELIGGRKIHFTLKEKSNLKHINPQSIKLIGTKPIPSDLFRYHVKRNYFIRADNSSTRKDNLLFFGALLEKCAAAGKMIVCAFTLRVDTQTNLCYMIPNIELGGFYLSKVAYEGSIGDKSEVLHHYETQNQVTGKQVALWKKAINQLNMNYHPYMFKSYKLECQMQIVEKLALDKKPGPPPIDTIEQSFLKTYKKMTDLVPAFKNMYPDVGKSDEPPKAKKAKKTKAT